jgi:hypothetical protein
MATLEELVAQRDRIQSLLASGIKQIRTEDKWAYYGNAGELRQTLATLNRQIASLQGSGIKTVLFECSKGD